MTTAGGAPASGWWPGWPASTLPESAAPPSVADQRGQPDTASELGHGAAPIAHAVITPAPVEAAAVAPGRTAWPWATTPVEADPTIPTVTAAPPGAVGPAPAPPPPAAAAPAAPPSGDPQSPDTSPDTTAGHRHPTAATPSGAVGPAEAPPLSPAAAPAATSISDPDPRRALIGEDLAALAPVSDDHARALAARFAADYLSWDEDAPHIRWHVLEGYFADPGAPVLGWNGRGRQHVDLVIPAAVTRISPQRVVVEVTVRIVLHERTSPPVPGTGGRAELGDPPAGSTWSSATPPGVGPWQATGMAWTVLPVPVGRGSSGRLEVQPRPGPRRRIASAR